MISRKVLANTFSNAANSETCDTVSPHDIVIIAHLIYLLNQWVHYLCRDSCGGDEEACGAIHGDPKGFN